MTSVEEIIEISKNDYVNYDHREGKRKVLVVAAQVDPYPMPPITVVVAKIIICRGKMR